VGTLVYVGALAYVMIATRTIPERAEELAWVLAALYGANQLKQLGRLLVHPRPDSLPDRAFK